MNKTVEAYAEQMVRNEWKSKLVVHGESTCQDCGHSGWAHSPRGCCVYVNPPMVTCNIGSMTTMLIDNKLTSEELLSYQCKCQNPHLCKDNEQIIFGRHIPEVQNEPLSRYEGK